MQILTTGLVNRTIFLEDLPSPEADHRLQAAQIRLVASILFILGDCYGSDSGSEGPDGSPTHG
jgi:hypothetical protein